MLSVFNDTAGGASIACSVLGGLARRVSCWAVSLPPVDPVGESLPDIPLRTHEGSESSVEDIWDEMWDDEDDVLGAYREERERIAGAVGVAGVGQGGAGAPAVYGLVVKGLYAMAAGAGDPAVAVDDDVTSDMEDLF